MTNAIVRYTITAAILTAALWIAAEDTARAFLGWEHPDAP